MPRHEEGRQKHHMGKGARPGDLDGGIMLAQQFGDAAHHREEQTRETHAADADEDVSWRGGLLGG